MMKNWATFYRHYTPTVVSLIKLMKGKALRKHSLHRKKAASVLLKLFISKHCSKTKRFCVETWSDFADIEIASLNFEK